VNNPSCIRDCPASCSRFGWVAFLDTCRRSGLPSVESEALYWTGCSGSCPWSIKYAGDLYRNLVNVLVLGVVRALVMGRRGCFGPTKLDGLRDLPASHLSWSGGQCQFNPIADHQLLQTMIVTCLVG